MSSTTGRKSMHCVLTMPCSLHIIPACMGKGLLCHPWPITRQNFPSLSTIYSLIVAIKQSVHIPTPDTLFKYVVYCFLTCSCLDAKQQTINQLIVLSTEATSEAGTAYPSGAHE